LLKGLLLIFLNCAPVKLSLLLIQWERFKKNIHEGRFFLKKIIYLALNQELRYQQELFNLKASKTQQV